MEQGRHADALRRLAKLEARFPRGAHQPELWLARIDCHVRLGQPERAAPDLDRYLAAHSDSGRAAELFFLRAELHRKAERWTSAEADYARVETGPRAADARYLQGLSAERASHFETAQSALRAYLSKYPDGRYAAEARARLEKMKKE